MNPEKSQTIKAGAYAVLGSGVISLGSLISIVLMFQTKAASFKLLSNNCYTKIKSA